MADETRSNLEPIEEDDLKLKEKFMGGGELGKENRGDAVAKIEMPPVHVIEDRVERKEGTMEKEAAYSKILSKVNSQKHITTNEVNVKEDAQAVSLEMDAESKIKNLVTLAETKGVPHAVKVARHMEDNFTLDEFHDRLLGEELHSALVEKGMIKEI